MDRFVCPVSSTDNILRVKDAGPAIYDVVRSDWIQMVNNDWLEDLITLTSEITSVVPNNDLVAKPAPFGRVV